MAERKTSKKVTRIAQNDTRLSSQETESFVVTQETKKKAKKLRIFAIISWIVAIGLEISAITFLNQEPINSTLLIILVVLTMIFAIIGSLIWKKSNRLDPASEKEKIKFFIQNQLGMIITIIAFLPLIILIFTNKNMDKKQKSLVGVIAIAAMLIAGAAGIDFNPPSQEQYLEQTQKVQQLNNGQNLVYWTKSGKSYHLYEDCSYINTDRTTEIFEGTVAQARELKNITDLCDRCARRAEREMENKTTEN